MNPRLAKLPRKVADCFTSIADHEVLNDPDVVEATNKMQALQAQHAAYQAETQREREAVEEAATRLHAVEAAVAEIDAGRPALARRAAVGDKEADRMDRDAQARRADLERQRALLAMGVEEARQSVERRSLNPYGSRVSVASTELDETIFSAKLERAERNAR